MKWLDVISELWNAILEESANVWGYLVSTWLIIWDRMIEIIGPYAIPVFYLALVLLLWMVFDVR